MNLLAREHCLRDLVARLDQALDTLELLDYDENDVAEIASPAVDRVERAIKAAADFLHELNAKESASRAVPQLRDEKGSMRAARCIAAALLDKRLPEKGYPCPSHDDEHPSVSLRDGEDILTPNTRGLDFNALGPVEGAQ